MILGLPPWEYFPPADRSVVTTCFSYLLLGIFVFSFSSSREFSFIYSYRLLIVFYFIFLYCLSGFIHFHSYLLLYIILLYHFLWLP